MAVNRNKAVSHEINTYLLSQLPKTEGGFDWIC